MSETEASTAGREVIAAFSAADWDRLRQLLSDDVVYEEIGTGRRFEGVDEYIALCEGWRGATPDVVGTVERVADEGD